MTAQLAELEAISLHDLVDTAELLTRVDRKYIVPQAAVAGLLCRLPTGSRVLEIDGRRALGYRSTYLDTPGLDSFFAAGRGRRRRWKVRRRCYLDSGASYLEVKTRGPRGTTVKTRIESREEHLDPAERSFVADWVGADTVDRLRPILETEYRRTTLLLPSASRVTFDSDLVVRSRLDDREVALPGLVVVETKSGSTPGSLDRALWRLGHRPVRMSKYGTGLAGLHPELPRLKWHRVLDHHLSHLGHVSHLDQTPRRTP